MKLKSFLIILAVTGVILLIPLMAMQFTSEVNWNISDFIIMGILLIVVGLTIDRVFSKVSNLKYRILICSAIVLVFLLIWAELAVGIFGTPFAGN